MNKVICEICGTSYPETAEKCPICGYTHELIQMPRTEVEEAEPAQASAAPVKGGRFSAANVRKRNKATQAHQVRDEEEPDDDGDDDEPRESSAVLVALLVIVIVALLSVTAYIAVRYVIPNLGEEEATEPSITTEATTEAAEETEPPVVPCTSLVLTSGGTALLEQVGQHWLLNVIVLPVDSTDALTYESSDENVATVNSEGRVTAVGPGEAVITIRCGEQALECRIVCSIPEETETAEASE